MAQWFRSRTENVRGTRKTMIVALARKLLISLWRLVRDGVPHIDRRTQKAPNGFGPALSACDGSPMTVRGGGDPLDSMAYHAVTENGPAASELRYRCAMTASCSELSRSGAWRGRSTPQGQVRRPTLTAPVRAGFALRVGTKKTGFQVEQRNCSRKQGREIATLKSLDNKNPIQGVQTLL